MANNYCTITNSDASLSKRFKAVQMRPVFEKTFNSEKVSGGGLDITVGGVYKSWQLVFRVRYEHSDEYPEEYGLYDDLVTMYGYNNPNGTPSNALTLVDWWGNTHSPCYLVGRMVPEPLTTIIDGECANFIIPIEIIEKP